MTTIANCQASPLFRTFVFWFQWILQSTCWRRLNPIIPNRHISHLPLTGVVVLKNKTKILKRVFTSLRVFQNWLVVKFKILPFQPPIDIFPWGKRNVWKVFDLIFNFTISHQLFIIMEAHLTTLGHFPDENILQKGIAEARVAKGNCYCLWSA